MVKRGRIHDATRQRRRGGHNSTNGWGSREMVRRRVTRSRILASNQYDPPSLSGLTVNQVRNGMYPNFGHFEQDPDEALLLHHLNRGFTQFNTDDDVSLAQDVKKEVLLPAETLKLKKEFRKRVQISGFLTCAACGIRDPYRKQCVLMRLDELGVLQMDEDQAEMVASEHGASLHLPVSEVEWKTVYLHQLRSYYQSRTGAVYHLHPEFVDEDEGIAVCKDCCRDIRKGKVPPLSIAGGIDFGDLHRLGLTRPNAYELALISKVRLYFKVIKIASNSGDRNDYTHSKLRGHMICFDAKSPEITANLLKKHRMKDLIKIHFTGPDGEIDGLAAYTHGSSTLLGRAWVVYQWIAVLKCVNPFYAACDLPPFDVVKDYVQEENEELVKTALISTEETDLVREAAIGDDVACIRSTLNQDHLNSGTREWTMEGPHLSSAFVGSSAPDGDLTQKVLRESARLVGMQEDSVPRGDTPLSEFDENDRILSGCFPHLFMYGRAYGRNGSLTDVQTRHLLLQYTTVAATTPEVVYLLFNQHTRHQNIGNLSREIKCNPRKYAAVARTLESNQFQDTLRKALQRPKTRTKEAKAVFKVVMPLLQLAAKTSRFGSLDATPIKGQLVAMCRFRGPASVFLTLTPDDVNNPRSFRLALRSSSNRSFPAKCRDDEDLIRMMMENGIIIGEGAVPIPVDYDARAVAAKRNPVATSLEYMKLIQCVLEVLVGIKLTLNGGKDVKTQFFLEGRKGMYGRVMSLMAVTEAQSRNALHMHAAIFGGLGAHVLQAAANMPEACQAVAAALDTMYKGNIPKADHVMDLVCSKIQPILPPSLRRRQLPSALKSELAALGGPNLRTPINHHEAIGCGCNKGRIHNHTFTCHKGANGHHGCRLCRKLGLIYQTGPVQIDQDATEEAGPILLHDNIQPKPPGSSSYFDPSDDRIIAWEISRPILDDLGPASTKEEVLSKLERCLHPEDWGYLKPRLELLGRDLLVTLLNELNSELPERNGYVVETTPLLDELVGGHNNVQLLGNTVQSKAALFYLTKYLAKDKTMLATFLITLEKARRYVIEGRYMSQEDRRGESMRFMRQWMIRALNSMDGMEEVADTQAAAAILGIGAVVSSDKFALVPVRECINYRLKQNRGDFNQNDQITDRGAAQDKYDSDDSFLATDDEVDDLDDEDDDDNEEQQDAELGSQPDAEAGVESCCNLDCGSATVFVVQEDEKKVLIPVLFPQRYNYRGECFRHYNRQEYTCLVRIQPQDNDELLEDGSSTTRRRGRKKSRRFKLGKGHPVEASHQHVLHTKQRVPMYTGRVPPWPGEPPANISGDSDNSRMMEWMSKANECARFLLTAFRPEVNNFDDDHRDDSLKFDHEALLEFLNDLRRSPSVISKSRLHLMHTTIQGLSTEHIAKVLLSRYRRRNRDLWEEWQKVSRYSLDQNNFTRADELDALAAQMEQETLTKNEYINGIKVSNYSREMSISLSNSVPSQATPGSYTTSALQQPAITPDDDVLEVYEKLRGASENCSSLSLSPEDLMPSRLNHTPESLAEREAGLSAYIKSKHFTAGQKKVVDLFLQHYRDIDEHGKSRRPETYVITGDPGAGKSYTIDATEDLKSFFNVACPKVTFMGIAAVNISGSTIQSLFDINEIPSAYSTSMPRLSLQKLENLRRLFQVDPSSGVRRCILVMDEGGMIRATLLAAVDTRMREVTGVETEPFGGVVTFIFGDFNQLDPVKAKSLTSVAVAYHYRRITLDRLRHNAATPKSGTKRRVHGLGKKAARRHSKKDETVDYGKILPSSFQIRGIDLFTNAKWFHIEGQQRSKDPDHTALLKRMCDGQHLTLKDLEAFETLSPEDPADFEFAPLLVSTNRERFDLTQAQTIRFAAKHRSHVIRWPLEVRWWKGKPSGGEADKVRGEDPVFWQYFVPGAPGYITHNINVEKGLVNGTSVVCHSITPRDANQGRLINQYCDTAAVGGTLTLELRPKSVNVEVICKASIAESLSDCCLFKEEQVTGGPVIPLVYSTKTYDKDEVYTVRGGPFFGCRPSKVKVKQSFPFDLGFAMTIHKAQGRTMKRLILVLSERPVPACQMRWSAIYVALSRVSQASDIRLLIKDPLDRTSIEYISGVAPKVEVKSYFGGFPNSNGATWNPILSYDSIP